RRERAPGGAPPNHLRVNPLEVAASECSTWTTMSTVTDIRERGDERDPYHLRDRRWPLELALQAALIVGAALLYFAVRGVTEGAASAAVANGYRVLRFEDTLGIAVEESVQNAVLGRRWLTTVSNWVYIWGHW